MKDFSGNLKRIIAPGGRRSARTYLAGLTLLAGLLAMGCAQGAYPLDIFYEMHYQPSYKAHEPPRLSPPESAVPFFDPPAATSFNLDGQHLYEVNCSMCHGAEGQGDGPVLRTLIEAYAYLPPGSQRRPTAEERESRPDYQELPDYRLLPDYDVPLNPDLTSTTAKNLGVDGMKGYVQNGITVMPSFTKLLTPAEIDGVIGYVADCLQGANPAGC